MKLKNIILLSVCAAVILLGALFTGTFAKYIRSAGEVVNKFNPADSVNPTVDEDFDDTVKKNVSFNVGNTEYPVYVRAAIVITWKKGVDTDEDGEIDDYIVAFIEPVKGTDYTLDINTANWDLRADGYYYYTKDDSNELLSVESEKDTKVFIKSCEQIGEPPENYKDYTLSVEIIVQTVQAVGYTDENEIPAWQDAWPSGIVKEIGD